VCHGESALDAPNVRYIGVVRSIKVCMGMGIRDFPFFMGIPWEWEWIWCSSGMGMGMWNVTREWKGIVIDKCRRIPHILVYLHSSYFDVLQTRFNTATRVLTHVSPYKFCKFSAISTYSVT